MSSNIVMRKDSQDICETNAFVGTCIPLGVLNLLRFHAIGQQCRVGGKNVSAVWRCLQFLGGALMMAVRGEVIRGSPFQVVMPVNHRPFHQSFERGSDGRLLKVTTPHMRQIPNGRYEEFECTNALSDLQPGVPTVVVSYSLRVLDSCATPPTKWMVNQVRERLGTTAPVTIVVLVASKAELARCAELYPNISVIVLAPADQKGRDYEEASHYWSYASPRPSGTWTRCHY